MKAPPNDTLMPGRLSKKTDEAVAQKLTKSTSAMQVKNRLQDIIRLL